MASEVTWCQELTNSLLFAHNEKDFIQVISNAACELGFEYCAYVARMPLPVSNPETIMLSDYPEPWKARYASENYLLVDPTVAHAFRSTTPFSWADELFTLSEDFWQDVYRHGLRGGLAQSVFDARAAVGILTLARSTDPVSKRELDDVALRMSWLVHAVHARGMIMLSSKMPSQSSVILTARETEVLRWTADGKTSSEVGQIMVVSERTVNFHITNALAKLGAVNRTAGVVKAAMLRLL